MKTILTLFLALALVGCADEDEAMSRYYPPGGMGEVDDSSSGSSSGAVPMPEPTLFPADCVVAPDVPQFADMCNAPYSPYVCDSFPGFGSFDSCMLITVDGSDVYGCCKD